MKQRNIYISSHPPDCTSYFANSPVSVNSDAVIPTSKIQSKLFEVEKYNPVYKL